MNKEFIPYEQALALKELGFDEPCFGYYNGQGNYIGEEGKTNSNCNKLGMHGAYCTAPLYQQAFRWFREEYVLDSIVQPTYSTKYQYRVFNVETKSKVQVYGDYMGKEFKTYEEAELACLIKLIELTKNKQQ
jgi:hypothetical protein